MTGPRIGVLASVEGGVPDAVREAGGEPVALPLPAVFPEGGVALRREWVADHAQVLAGAAKPDALILDADDPADLFGLVLAALRLDLPAVVGTSLEEPYAVALAGMGLAPLSGGAVGVAIEVGRSRWPRPGGVIGSFSLANALRAGLVAGAGPELPVHLAAVAREAGETGFGQVIRVLTPESPALVSASLLGARALLASLGDALHDVPTVTGPLKEALPLAPEALPEPATQLRFVRGRASGIEALASAPPETAEFSGTCRLFRLESRAVRAVERGSVEPGDLILVPGCGPRGGPGLLRLDRLGEALRGAGLETPVLTDGLPPAGEAAEPTGAPWVSLFTPEAATGGVIARLRDGDFLRIVLKDGVIRTSINAEDFALREAPYRPTPTGAGYATRYATSAAAALEGAGFGPDDR